MVAKACTSVIRLNPSVPLPVIATVTLLVINVDNASEADAVLLNPLISSTSSPAEPLLDPLTPCPELAVAVAVARSETVVKTIWLTSSLAETVSETFLILVSDSDLESVAVAEETTGRRIEEESEDHLERFQKL